MEFRIFLPRLTSEEFKSTSLHSSYEAVLSSLIMAFESISNVAPESREDTYLVGGCHFGLKSRGGKKLELKIRRKKLDFNIEHWKKIKLGKKSLNSYKKEILALLESESDQQLPEDVQLITAENFLTVEKSRKTQQSGEVSKELCLIKTPVDSRLWISFAIEGSLEDIRNFLMGKKETNSYASLIFEGLYLAVNLAKSDQNFLPVVSGYPTWVRVASNSLRDNDEFNEILGSAEVFLISVNFVSSFASDGGISSPQQINPKPDLPISNHIRDSYCFFRSCMK